MIFQLGERLSGQNVPSWPRKTGRRRGRGEALEVSNLAAILFTCVGCRSGAAQAAIPAVELAVEVAPGEVVASLVVYPAATAHDPYPRAQEAPRLFDEGELRAS
jgi:hypothetical protein